MREVFYYHFKKNYVWLVFNFIALLSLYICLQFHPYMVVWWQIKLLIALFVLSLMVWIYKYVIPHQMAVIDDDAIKIDFTNPLKWNDVRFAEEKIIDFYGRKKHIVVLIPKDNLNYKYNFLQRHNGPFPPFSIPLYGILSKDDESKILNILDKKTKLKRL